MKWFLILLAISLTASEKLDRTYLPPPGAQFAGGNPGDIQAPLELPNLSQAGTIQIGSNQNGLQEFGAKGQSTQAPVTTTSYAFTQTTTYPSIESYETTVVPINPVTGLPIQNLGQPGYQQNGQLPGYNQNYGQVGPSYDTNVQPGFISQGPMSTIRPSTESSSTYSQAGNQPFDQFSNGQVLGSTGSNSGIPEGASQQPGYAQYADGNLNNQVRNQYPNQNVPGVIQIPGSGPQVSGANQGSTQYPGAQNIPGRQVLIPSTASPSGITSNTLPENQYTEIGPKGPLGGELSQGTYSGQPINIQDSENPQLNQGIYNQGQPGQDPTQQPTIGNQNILSPGAQFGQHDYQPGSGYNSVTSSTATPGYASSTSAYSASPKIRPERPQAASDRNAVILNYENVRTPTGYSYSYDTSNGIHADETGTVTDGTKAEGGYSYIGDDGKVYTVRYTADENGFQPRGDHIPTSPPIPEAIQKVIEQAARDRAAGIIDDGSYDEAKYGHKNYQRPTHHRRPQTHNLNKFKNNQVDGRQDDTIVPISGITDEEYDERIPQDQVNDNISTGGIQKKPIVKYSSRRLPGSVTDQNGTPNKADTQNLDNQQISRRPSLGAQNLSEVERNNNIQQNKFNSGRPGTSEREPISTGGPTQYTETNTDRVENNDNYPNNEAALESDTDDNKVNEEEKYYQPGQTSITSSDDSTTIGNIKQNFNQRPKGSRPPTISNNRYIKGKRPTHSQMFNQDDVNDYVSKPKDISPSGKPDYSQNNDIAQIPGYENNQEIGDNGYRYIPPQPQFSQTQFPTRFRDQELPSTIKPYRPGTTARPFQTPEVYNQPSGNKQNEAQSDNQQSTTRKPFMTSRVTTPKDTTYTDYDDGDNYGADQDIDDEDIYSTESPNKKIIIGSRRPSQPKQSTTRPQYAPFGLKTGVTQKGTVAPEQESEYYSTGTPGYSYGTTTPIPTQSSRFGSTEKPRKTMTQHQRRPSASRRPGSSTAVGRPTLSPKPGAEISDNRYQTTSPLGYPGTTVIPGPSSTAVKPGYGSRLPYGQTAPTPQNYPTYTVKPTTAVPTNPEYQPDSRIRSQYSTTVRPQQPTSPSFVPGTYPTSTPGYYQTTYQQVPIDNTGTTVGPPISGKPSTFILPGGGTTTPQSIQPYHPGYHYAAPMPGFTTTIGSSTPGNRPYYTQPSSPGYEYSPTGPTFSTTTSPSTIGTTPFIPSSTAGRPFQEYSTTQSPSYSSTQGVYGQNPTVDGFGRPIVFEQQPGYSPTGQGLNQYPGTQLIDGNNSRPETVSSGLNGLPSGDTSRDNLKPMYGGDQAFNYPGYYGQPQVVGEDFSGPKQPQRFDPQTGYHYK